MAIKKKNVYPTEHPHIVKIDGVLGGQAIIEGTRIAVWHIVGYYYKVGLTVEDILAEWDYLMPAQIFSALAYYHDNKEEIDEVREANSYEAWKQEQLARKAYASA
jgi:uncharacterized protein (DUF433 family)